MKKGITVDLTSFVSRSTLTLCLIVGLLNPFSANAHEDEDARVEVELESASKVSAGKVTIEFQLVDTKNNNVVTPSELNITHEKKLHFLSYDPALKEFRHVHPEFDGQLWKAELELAVDGKYFIWAQGELAADSEEFSALARLEVENGQAAWPLPPRLTDNRSGADLGSVATLSNQILRAGRMAMLTLKFTRADGSPAMVTPYLGAFAHVISTPDDGDSLIHIHPMNGSSNDEGMLHVTFPKEGFYRVWVQFIEGGALKTIPLSVEVKK